MNSDCKSSFFFDSGKKNVEMFSLEHNLLNLLSYLADVPEAGLYVEPHCSSLFCGVLLEVLGLDGPAVGES